MLKSIFITLLFIPFLSFCQQKNAYSSSVDSIVKRIDNLVAEKAKFTTKEKSLDDKKIKEQWLYFDNKQFSFFSINYNIDSTAYSEKYYLQNGSLIYAIEKEVSYFPHLGKNQSSTWGANFYLSKGKLVDHVTLGHGRSETEDWDPESEVLQLFKQRKAEAASLK